jgi:hypothetical protein
VDHGKAKCLQQAGVVVISAILVGFDPSLVHVASERAAPGRYVTRRG